MRYCMPSTFAILAAATSLSGILPSSFASPTAEPATNVIINPLPPPIIVCPVSQIIRCCLAFDPLSDSSAASDLTAAGVIITNSSEIIGFGCFPFPLSTVDEAIIGICEPRCCLREIPLADSTAGETIAIGCLPVDPIPGPILPITAL